MDSLKTLAGDMLSCVMLDAMRAIRQRLRTSPSGDPCLLLYPLVTACVASTSRSCRCCRGSGTEGLSSLQAGVLLAAGPAVMSLRRCPSAGSPIVSARGRPAGGRNLRGRGQRNAGGGRGFPGCCSPAADRPRQRRDLDSRTRRRRVAPRVGRQAVGGQRCGLLLGPLIAGVVGQSQDATRGVHRRGIVGGDRDDCVLARQDACGCGRPAAGGGGAAGLRLAIADPRVRIGALGLLMLGLTRAPRTCSVQLSCTPTG